MLGGPIAIVELSPSGAKWLEVDSARSILRPLRAVCSHRPNFRRHSSFARVHVQLVHWGSDAP